MNKLINDSDLSCHNMSNNIQDKYMRNIAKEDYIEMLKAK